MGIDLKKGPPLPAPTETDSPTATELTTDVSKATDDKSSYSIPEDGSVTIRTRDRNRSKGTAVLIEYFEGGQAGALGSGSDRKPSVRVRLTPSKKGRNDHIQITETREASRRKASLGRRTPGTPTTPSKAQADFVLGEDDQSISSYASATEESNVSRNQPIEVGIDLRGNRRRRPTSPLIPSSETMSPFQAQSEISAIPTNSFLDGSGPTRTPEGKRVHTPSSDKIKTSKQREKVKIADKTKERSERKSSKSKSRTSSLSEKKERERVESPRRRSSRSHQESVVSAGDSSIVSDNLSPSHRSYETSSLRSGSSKSINNPKLLETVEDAIRRLILPEINAIKREQSRRESGRRGSFASTGTSGSREDISSDRRRSSGKVRESRHRDARDREGRHHEYATSSPRPYDDESHDGSSIRDASSTPKRSGDRLKAAAAAGVVAGGLMGAVAAGAMRDSKSPASDTRDRRRRRAETPRSQSRASDAYTDEYDEDHLGPSPPMPLTSEVNASDVTRASIRSADTDADRPLSAADEVIRAHRAAARGSGSLGSTPTPTKTPVDLQHGLGTQHTNVSRGDLTALRSKRDDDSVQPIDQHVLRQPEDDLDEMEAEDGEYDYYNTQDNGLPAHIKYEPYQPERRGLSPIPSVSGYTEGGSEAQRDSRVTYESESPEKSSRQEASRDSPDSVPSNVMSRDFDQHSDGHPSARSSTADYRNTTYTDDSELERVTSGQAIRGIGANPDISHAPIGLESQVASLIDGSMIDASVLSAGDYAGPRDSVVSYDDPSYLSGNRNVSPRKESYDSRKFTEDDRESTPVSRRDARSQEFPLEYEPDQYGRKIPQASTSDRHSPTESEEAAAIAQSAVQSAIKRIKAREGKPAAAEDTPQDGWVGAGVGRNKSFKDRTLEGREPANTPAHSIDRFEYDDDHPKMGASGIPNLDDPMPEIGFVDDAQTQTEPSVAGDGLDGAHDDDYDEGRATPKPIARGRRQTVVDHEAAAFLETAAALAAISHSRQPSQEQEEEWHRTSDDKKRDTMGTNPFEGISPVANPHDHIFGATNYGLGFNTGSPGGIRVEDEGYKSQDPNRTPDFQPRQKGLADPSNAGDLDNPFYEPGGHARNFSGGSHGMTTSFYNAATGGGIENIENKDIVALMQNLVARDAQQRARDVEVAELVLFLTQELRQSFGRVDNSFQGVEERIKKAQGAIVDEIEESEKVITKTLGASRHYPGSASAGRSIQGGSLNGDDTSGRKPNGNKIIRALKGLRSGTNDLSRIEDMLFTLLKEVEELKSQGKGSSVRGPSLDNLTQDRYEHDHGYEPEGRAGTASQASQSGRLSASQSRLPSRRYSENRISTVHEASEEGQESMHGLHNDGPYSDPNLLTPGQGEYQRGSSVPLDTRRQSAMGPAPASLSNENTPRTAEKGKKHKSSGSTGLISKLMSKSRWSESTNDSGPSKPFRFSGQSRKDHDSDLIHHPQHAASRSGSNLAGHAGEYPLDPYGDDHLHTGFSNPDLPATSQTLERMAPPRTTYMTPEDPKYKVHRNSLNLQHPQPRQGQTEKFKMALETQAHIYDSPTSPKSADWAGSATSLHRFMPHNTATTNGEYWSASPVAASGPPRPPKEPIEEGRPPQSPARQHRISKLVKGSPLPHHSVESGYGTATATHTHYTGSPKLENRNLSGALGVPTRRPSGPRAMTPKSAEEEAAREERRRKRDTFGTITSQDTDTF